MPLDTDTRVTVLAVAIIIIAISLNIALRKMRDDAVRLDTLETKLKGLAA